MAKMLSDENRSTSRHAKVMPAQGWLSALLALAMVVSLCPAQALAEMAEVVDDDQAVEVIELVEEDEATLGEAAEPEAADALVEELADVVDEQEPAEEPAEEPTEEEPALELVEDSAAEETASAGEDDEDGLESQGITVYTETDTGYQYTVNSDGTTATLYKYVGTPSNGEAVIPPVVGGKNVSAIGAQCFMGNDVITTVRCDGKYQSSAYRVTTVGDEAFKNCTKLKRVELPRSVRSLGASCFAGTTKLQGVNSLGVTWSGNTSDVEYSFLTRDEMQLQSIGSNCFSHSGIEVAYLPSSVWFVGSDAFRNCAKLRRVDMPQNGVTLLGDGAFSYCTMLTEITIPIGVYNILAGTFFGCTALERVYVHENLTTIDKKAFYGCTALEEFGMPGTIKTAYGAGKKLKTGSFQYEADTTTTSAGAVNLQTIGKEAFLDCQSMTDFNFGTKLKTIGSFAFLRCYDLESATLPNTVTSIGRTAFANCTSLTSFAFPANDTFAQVPFEVLSGCTGIEAITVPGTVTKVSYNAFSRMTGLVDAYFANANTEFEFNYDGTTDLSPFTNCGGKAIVHGPASGVLQNDALICKGYGHIRDFVADSSANRVTLNLINSYDSSQNVTYTLTKGSKFTLPSDGFSYTPQKAIYRGVLVGWEWGSNEYDLGETITVNEDMNIYADFSQRVRVIFYAVGGTFAETGTNDVELCVDAQGKIPEFPVPVREGYHLKARGAWSASAGAESGEVTASDVFTTKFRNYIKSQADQGDNGKPIEVRAQWDPDNPSTITLDASPGNINGSETIEIQTDSHFRISGSDMPRVSDVVAPAHYTFTGKWLYYYAEGLSRTYTRESISADTFTEDSRLEAVFEPKLVTKVVLDKTSATLGVGKTLQLKATVTPADAADASVTWSSSNTKVAKVTNAGKVTGVAAGTATITAQAADGSGKKATCKITVGKGANGLSASAKKTTVTTPYSPAKATTLASNIKVSGANGAVTFANASTNATAKKFTVNKSTGAVTVPKATAAGTYATIIKVTAAGDASHNAGTKSVSYKITVSKLDLSKATVAAIADQPYTGKAIKPSPKVTYGGATLKAGTDYTLSYANNVKVGNAAKVTITGKGNYTGTVTKAFRIAFKDVAKSHPFYDQIHRANDLKIINGYRGDKEGLFGPADNITRGQIAVMLWNAAGQPKPAADAKIFPDATNPKAYYYDAVRWAASVGVVNGYATGKFGPDDNITREQLAVMVANYASKIAKQKVSGSAADLSKLPDAGSVSGYAVSSVAWCYKKGVLVLQSGKLNATKTADRATAAQMVLAAHELAK